MQVRVAHLIAYLQTLPLDMEVILDKDGWMEDAIQPKDEIDLIKERGLFTHVKLAGYDEFLVINN